MARGNSALTSTRSAGESGSRIIERATRHAIARSNPGDLIVICVDQHASVMSELESYGRQAQPGARRGDHASTNSVSDPDFVVAPTEPSKDEPSLF